MKKIFLLTLLVLTFGISSVSINAAIFTVTRNDDRNALCATGDCSLREAVTAANADASDDTIIFADGLSLITLTNEIVIENVGALNIAGSGANKLTVDGGAGKNRIFRTNNAIASIAGVTLTGGNGLGAIPYRAGGAILVVGGSLYLDRLHITNNSMPIGLGGGVYFESGTHRITNSTISDNSANYCGGGFGNAFGSVLTIVNSTISKNTSGSDGGGFCNEGNTTLRNVTITDNTAGSGSGITNKFGTLNFGNTIVANNTATDGFTSAFEIRFDSGKVFSAGGNLVGDSGLDSTATETAVAYQPSDIRDADPVLGELQNNGGTVPTHALLPGSPLIDAGDNTLTSEQFDARGFPRIVDGNGDGAAVVDIGAFEVQPQRRRVRRDRGLFFSF